MKLDNILHIFAAGIQWVHCAKKKMVMAKLSAVPAWLNSIP